MSPYRWNGTAPTVFFVYGSSNPGYLNDYNIRIGNSIGVRPVISLSIGEFIEML